MNAAHAAKDFGTGTQEQVISIREKNLGAGVLERLRELRLYRGLGSHGHEERRLHIVVQSLKRCGSRTRAGGLRVEAEVQSRAIHGQEFT